MLPDLSNTSLGFAKFASNGLVAKPAAEQKSDLTVSSSAQPIQPKPATTVSKPANYKVKPKSQLTADEFTATLGRPLFFSTQAIRTQLIWFLGDLHKEANSAQSDLKQLVLDFNRLSDTPSLPDEATNGVLMVTPKIRQVKSSHSNKPLPRSDDGLQFGKLETTNTGKTTLKQPVDLGIRQVFYRNFVYSDLVPDILKLDLPPLEKTNGVVQPNVMLNRNNEIITSDQFTEKGVTQSVNRFWQKIFQRLQPITEKGPFNQWVSVKDNGQTTLFKRFSFNWVENYADNTGQKLHPFALEKLPSGEVVDVKDFEDYAAMPLTKGKRKKTAAFLEGIIRDQFDANYFTLDDQHQLSGLLIPEAKESTAILKSNSTNPFAQAVQFGNQSSSPIEKPIKSKNIEPTK